MKLSQAFAAVDNTVLVEHPLGGKFNLLPFGHADAWDRLHKKYPIAKLNKLGKVFAGGQATINMDLMAEHFETMEEFLESVAAMAAAHCTGWEGLTEDDGSAIPYTFDRCIELAKAHRPFLEWLDANAKALKDALETETESEEEIKKN